MDVQIEQTVEGSVRLAEIAPGIRIEHVEDAGRLSALEPLQVRVWGSGAGALVPVHVLHIVSASGGLVLIAYDGDRPVGFALGFLARRNGRLYHASHMLGIDPDVQSRGIGAALKWTQREKALAQGLDLMCWTFDPLEARNAHFNLHKLGVISRTYKENIYGELDDELNRGLPSDRLLVEWWLRQVPREHAPVSGDAVSILSVRNGKPALALDASVDGRPLRVAAPDNIQRIKREAPDVAMEWRLAHRAAFAWALARGYVVRDFAGGSYILEPGKE